MEVITDPSGCPRPARGTVVTIGAYDGVHVGHQALVTEVRKHAASLGSASAVVTFDRHPASVVRPGSAPKLLTDLEQKLELLGETGLDYAKVVVFDEARSKESAEDFVAEVVVDCLAAKSVVVGRDFHFGHGRRGNVELLERMGEQHGFEVVGMELVRDEDDATEAVSSTRVRSLLAAGRVEEAAGLLGRYHEVRGTVTSGDARGAGTLGYPTANVVVPQEIQLPGEGIYAGWFALPGHTAEAAAVYIGRRPTFYDAGERTLEAHLLDFDGDLYGEGAQVRFVARIREDRRFDRVEDLVEQMGRDAEAARALLADG